MLAAQRAEDAAMFKTLFVGGANFDSQSNQGVTALMVAATSGNTVAIESFLAFGANLEIKDLDGFTPLFHVIQSGEENDNAIETLNMLINGGSNVNAQDISGATPLMHAALSDRQDIAGMLLDAGAEIDKKDNVGWTALHFAARSPVGAHATELLVKNMSLLGHSADLPDNGGTTPLMIAAAYNNATTVGLLLEAGASFSRQDNTGRNAYEYASMKNATQALEVIKEAIEESQRVPVDHQARIN
jgi:serine/threonine-protein phosphatase 6 regulatory ankyrin repeat subunit A/serine/threonine-protein phosphatase 6 regulatory ankyrin repeat subunit B